MVFFVDESLTSFFSLSSTPSGKAGWLGLGVGPAKPDSVVPLPIHLQPAGTRPPAVIALTNRITLQDMALAAMLTE